MGVVHLLSGKQGKATALTSLKAIGASEVRVRRYCLNIKCYLFGSKNWIGRLYFTLTRSFSKQQSKLLF